MLTTCNFTRDEWSHLLRFFIIMNFSMFSCSHFLSIKEPNNKSKRAQERRTGEEPVVAQSRPVSLISRSLSANQCPMLDSGTSYSQENRRLGWNYDLTSTGKSWQDRNKNSASSSQVWHRDDNPFQVPRDRCERWIIVQVPGNWCVKYRIKLQGESWTTTISRSPILDTLRKSSRMFDKSWIVQRKTR